MDHINFLTKLLMLIDTNTYSNDDLSNIHIYLTNISVDEINDYKDSCTIFSYENDLLLLLDIFNKSIDILEKNNYDCEMIKYKKKYIEIIK